MREEKWMSDEEFIQTMQKMIEKNKRGGLGLIETEEGVAIFRYDPERLDVYSRRISRDEIGTLLLFAKGIKERVAFELQELRDYKIIPDVSMNSYRLLNASAFEGKRRSIERKEQKIANIEDMLAECREGTYRIRQMSEVIP